MGEPGRGAAGDEVLCLEHKPMPPSGWEPRTEALAGRGQERRRPTVTLRTEGGLAPGLGPRPREGLPGRGNGEPGLGAGRVRRKSQDFGSARRVAAWAENWHPGPELRRVKPPGPAIQRHSCSLGRAGPVYSREPPGRSARHHGGNKPRHRPGFVVHCYTLPTAQPRALGGRDRAQASGEAQAVLSSRMQRPVNAWRPWLWRSRPS